MKTTSSPPSVPFLPPPAPMRMDIEGRIHTVRDQRVMLDSDLAILYRVATKQLNQAVKRHNKRFPKDFMFQLTLEEVQNLRSQKMLKKAPKNRLRSQIVTSSVDNYGGRRYQPYAFTEQGVAMLSSVLNSERAVQVNIAIMRTFVRLRQIVQQSSALTHKVLKMEEKYDAQLQFIFGVLDALIQRSTPEEKKPFGFSA